MEKVWFGYARQSEDSRGFKNDLFTRFVAAFQILRLRDFGFTPASRNGGPEMGGSEAGAV